MNIALLSFVILLATGHCVAITSQTSSKRRNLVIADWDVRIDSVSGQEFTFSTGDGGTSSPTVKIDVYDKCRSDWDTRTDVGDFYPTSTVTGIDVDDLGVWTPGENNDITLSFEEGISGNTDIYTDNGDDTATVEFCAQVGLFDSSSLVNFAELKMTYSIDLTTNASTLTGYSVTEAGSFTDAGTEHLDFDGTLNAYFCNPSNKAPLYDDGSTTDQGSEISVCFKAPDGQFEIKDVLDLTVKASGGSPSMQILSGGSFVSSAVGFAEKSCTDSGTSDTNICVVTAFLKAEFYGYSELELTGQGSLLLELGDASGSRRLSFRDQNGRSAFAGTVLIYPYHMRLKGKGSAILNGIIYIAAVGAIVGAALIRVFMADDADDEKTTTTEEASSSFSSPKPEGQPKTLDATPQIKALPLARLEV